MKQSLTILPPPRVLLGARIIAAFNTRKGTMGTKFIAKSRGDLREGSLLAVLRSGRWLTALWIGAATAADLDLDEYLQRASAAKSRNDWESAAGQYAQAINHADLPRDAATRSTMHLEYGRAMGALCQFGESEKYLLRAKEMATTAGGSLFPPLYELASLNTAQKQFVESSAWFSQLMPVIERESRAKSSPRLVADALEKYAVALAATGNADAADSRRREAEKIRAANPQPAALGSITPYGSQCTKR